ncbi:hypothetical protein [Pedobacter miscanthi]|uniref:Uncharacterized protein n=1 Tax=Pedobacter miscanthi TaxID=2259170 RepID=A0A366KRI0_9SPHI|nr:hypothetical protein [Pedobacter miscanthi]RBQ04245.1 hypothetical protein DRW42_18770 [Pedobacter miscanthi]
MQLSLASARRRRRAPSFWRQKEPKPRLAELINANKKDKQLINKTPAENFSLAASKLAWSVEPEKFVRPELW